VSERGRERREREREGRGKEKRAGREGGGEREGGGGEVHPKIKGTLPDINIIKLIKSNRVKKK
jgi:hypothetical protein